MVKFTADVETLIRCPMCHSTDIRSVYQKMHGDALLTYSLCKNCGLMFLNPRMTEASTTRYYQELYRKITLPTKEREEQDRKVQQIRAQIQHDFLKRNAPEIDYTSHLDIGCSAGYLLEKINAKLSAGVDPDSHYLGTDPIQKYTVYKSIQGLPYVRFTLITMSHVLEHINDPVPFMKDLISNNAGVGTYILVEVPNALATQDAYLFHHPIAFTGYTLHQLFTTHLSCELVATGFHGLGNPIQSYLIAIFKVTTVQYDYAQAEDTQEMAD